ncbi:acyltransferase family protein [Paraglaciecola sp. 2405UD69-4]|uniref:acyltransferase family protein n=1 Tax=Paraglaciecola sp. 2405UD69-4 TaxID=3391836 RepID=UPI0039C94610
MQYRPEIDGLRALAILPVLFFHAGVPGVSGGYIGVDVFFVISGYLITTLLIEDVNQQKFSIINFYERRARRILPALFVVIGVTSAVIPLITSHPDILSRYGNSLLSVSVFMSNFWFWSQSGYFGSVSETTPMLHTWSLSLEEQFYIVFPLCVAMFFRYGRKTFIVLIVISILISLAIAEWGWRNSSIANFYLIFTRAWELLFGALSALIFQRGRLASFRRESKSILSIAGLLLVLISNVVFDSNTPHPSLLTVVPVIGVVFIILFADQNNITGRILSNKAFVGVGLISYSLYLWHQPVLALSRILLGEDLSLLYVAFVLPIIGTLSYLSWRFIENPLRDKTAFSRAKIFKLSIIGTISTVIIGACFSANIIFQSIVSPENMTRYMHLKKLNDDSPKNMINSECHIWDETFSPSFIQRFEDCAQVYGKASIVLGGSHGMDLYNSIVKNTEKDFVVSVSRGFCRAHNMINGSQPPHRCQYEDFLTFLDTHSDSIESVVYTQTPDRLFTRAIYVATEADLHEPAIDQIVLYFANVQSKFNLPVYIIGMFPPLTADPEFFDYSIGLEEQVESFVSINAIKMSELLEDRFKSKIEHTDISFVSKMEAFDIRYPHGVMVDGQLIYSDKRHLNQFGERVMGKRLLDYLKKHQLDLFEKLK